MLFDSVFAMHEHPRFVAPRSQLAALKRSTFALVDRYLQTLVDLRQLDAYEQALFSAERLWRYQLRAGTVELEYEAAKRLQRPAFLEAVDHKRHPVGQSEIVLLKLSFGMVN